MLSARDEFMARVIAAAVATEFGPASREDVLALGTALGHSKDWLNTRLICNFFECGQDQLANDLMVSVEDKEGLGSVLMTVLQRRLTALVADTTSPDAMSLISRLPSSVYEWAKSRGTKVRPGECPVGLAPLASTCALLRNISSLLPAEHPDGARAASILDTLET